MMWNSIRGYWLLLAFGFSSSAHASLDYELTVWLDPTQQQLKGKVQLSVAEEQDVQLDVTKLQVTYLQRPLPAKQNKLNLHLRPGQTVKLSYQAELSQSRQDFLSPEHVLLNGIWYPLPQALARYRLNVHLPNGFLAYAPADRIQQENTDAGQWFHFDFPHLSEHLSLVASTNFVRRETQHNGVLLETYFFSEDAELAEQYLQRAAGYLDLYQQLLGAYPYQRFAMIESPMPMGHAMPSFTLLGQQIIRQPFVLEASLGHELLHQWLGNFLYVDAQQGNWVEGATQYLADHWYQQQQSSAAGAEYRKQILLDYHAYALGQALTPAQFKGRYDKASQAVGYGKVAMIFHQLRLHLGDEAFFQYWRSLLKDKALQALSWQDLIASLPAQENFDWQTWFAQWLERNDLPELVFTQPQLRVEQGRLYFSCALKQNSSPAFQFQAPLTVHYADGSQEKHWFLAQSDSIKIALSQVPTRIVFDEDYDLLRRLEPEEISPSLAWLMGSEAPLLVGTEAEWQSTQVLLQALGLEKADHKPAQDLSFAELSGRHLLFLNAQEPMLRRMLAETLPASVQTRLSLINNPYQPQYILGLLQGDWSNPQVARRLSHYGQYAQFAVGEQGNIQAEKAQARMGIPLYQRPADKALPPQQAANLTELLPELIQNRVIFVGEQHDKYAHHLNQLRVAQALQQAEKPFAIGLEMFQTPFQSVLDDYVSGKIDERAFLKQSEYFVRWRYDYNLYKPVLDYARAHQIPLIALNAPMELTQQIARQGFAGLSAEQQQQLPESVDLSQADYRADLKEIFALHLQHGGRKAEDFPYFLQAQALWDETMAQTAYQYLQQHPQHQLLIIAGNGHVRQGYGIPNRLQRRDANLSIVTLVQDEALLAGIADYVVLTDGISGQEAPKLGVMLEQKEQGLVVQEVLADSPAQKAEMKAGDRLLRLDNIPIESLSDLKFALLYLPNQDSVLIDVERAKQTLSLTLRFAHQ